MRKTIYIIIFLVIIAMFASLPALAHSGGTDSKGGHYDHSAGEYHYHHGYSAHQHKNGVCPYESDEGSTDSKIHWWTPLVFIFSVAFVFALPFLLSKTLQVVSWVIIDIVDFIKRTFQLRSYRTDQSNNAHNKLNQNNIYTVTREPSGSNSQYTSTSSKMIFIWTALLGVALSIIATIIISITDLSSIASLLSLVYYPIIAIICYFCLKHRFKDPAFNVSVICCPMYVGLISFLIAGELAIACLINFICIVVSLLILECYLLGNPFRRQFQSKPQSSHRGFHFSKWIIVCIATVLIVGTTAICIYVFGTHNELSSPVDDTSTTQVPQNSTAPVKELISSIRYNPDQFTNKQISIVATVYEDDEKILIFDLPEEAVYDVCSSGGVRGRYYARNYASNGSISIYLEDLPDSATILQTGDYIEISGMVEIRSDEICLVNCEYKMLKIREDRVK